MENFIEDVERQHELLGAKKGAFMLDEIKLNDAWANWAQDLKSIMHGQNPAQIKMALTKLSQKSAYLCRAIDREANRNAVQTFAEARMDAINNPKPVGDE